MSSEQQSTTSQENTATDFFTATVKDFFSIHLAKHLSQKLQDEKDFECTPEEICQWFDCDLKDKPLTAAIPNAAAAMATVPGYFKNTGTTPPKRRGGRKKKVIDPNAPKCIYVYTRGTNSGNTCGKPVVNDGRPGSEHFCKQCIKKKGAQKMIDTGDFGETGGNTVERPKLEGNSVEPQEQPSDESVNVTVTPIEGYDNLYHHEETGFLLEIDDDGPTAVGAMGEDGSHRELTEDEIVKATQIGFNVINTTQSLQIPSTSVTGSVTPNIPQVPMMTN